MTEKLPEKQRRPQGAPPLEAICAVCSIHFLTARRHAKTCSARCRKREERLRLLLGQCARWATPQQLQHIEQREREQWRLRTPRIIIVGSFR